ncbi:FdhD protein [Streptosporangium becharense]|uniref:Sulfur carrier protein FdhD n=1 Tax=Streptosporangium becharense TaxID=1816182 RepID=A0A7W9IEV0_9ACTN|nr:formate dehydrogenase accessory sulfurtransferase FdhD [Streptosporangium becharense]MBB2909647.1 FdhD protein [Streptosporangium becharense]MBB5819397.1 FdhD protein [Streptosporangium becharense]
MSRPSEPPGPRPPGIGGHGPDGRSGPTTRARITQVRAGTAVERRDDLATEEPLEIRIQAGGARRTVAITMRTPGHDFELAAGFLYGEGVVSPADVASIAYCTDEDVPPQARYNTVTVRLRGGLPDLPALERHFTTSSACGVCGSASLDALRDRCPSLPPGDDGLRVSPEVLYALPERLRRAQSVFGKTGGLHAAGLFTPLGEAVAVREDVGRHNAVDKLVGWALMGGRLPLGGHLLMVSGRTSYEIMQKALTAGLPVVCAVSAPSSLAVDLAREFGMTLVGFLRGERFNLYSAPERVGV